MYKIYIPESTNELLTFILTFNNFIRCEELYNKCYGNEYTTELLKYNISNNNKVFFCMEDKLIIGLCFIEERMVNNTQEKIEKYTMVEISKIDEKQVCLYPYIIGICKDKKYEKVGHFIITKVCDYFKDSKFVYIGTAIINKFDIVEEPEKFMENNLNFENYYKNLGFREKKNHYFVYSVNSNKYSDYAIATPVMEINPSKIKPLK